MVGVDGEPELAAEQVVSPVFETDDDGEQLQLASRVR